jgi:maltooligosyltrehalose synthase
MRPAFEKLYWEEAYLFDVVGPRFRETGRLSSYDFFFLVRWKANRAKGRVASLLCRVAGSDLETAVARLAGELREATTARARLLLLLGRWKLRLPMASAILTVLFPEEFTVYDVNVRQEVGASRNFAQRRDLDDVWAGYIEFKKAVERAAPAGLCLRDKDRFLFARSRHKSHLRFLETHSGA